MGEFVMLWPCPDRTARSSPTVSSFASLTGPGHAGWTMLREEQRSTVRPPEGRPGISPGRCRDGELDWILWRAAGAGFIISLPLFARGNTFPWQGHHLLH
jgi:hypothetical protein